MLIYICNRLKFHSIKLSLQIVNKIIKANSYISCYYYFFTEDNMHSTTIRWVCFFMLRSFDMLLKIIAFLIKLC